MVSDILSSWKKIIKERPDFTTGLSYDIIHLKLNISKLTKIAPWKKS